jgi:hypothetical protein
MLAFPESSVRDDGTNALGGCAEDIRRRRDCQDTDRWRHYPYEVCSTMETPREASCRSRRFGKGMSLNRFHEQTVRVVGAKIADDKGEVRIIFLIG